MSVEAFLKLKEINSLMRMKGIAEKAKNEQEDRVSRLMTKQEQSVSQITTLKHSLIAINLETADLEGRLKIAIEQRAHLVDLGGSDKKIQEYSILIEDLENEGFTLLEKAEATELEIKDHQEFLIGLEKTIKEISDEVTVEVVKSEREIENINTRLFLLTAELPEEMRQTYEKVQSKKLAYGPFTRIEQGSCLFCRYKISRIEESEIDMQKGLKTCTQCGRIFLPLGAD